MKDKRTSGQVDKRTSGQADKRTSERADEWIDYTIFRRAKRSRSCFWPTPVKSTVAFVLGPVPSRLITFPFPKRSCSTSIPTGYLYRMGLREPALMAGGLAYGNF